MQASNFFILRMEVAFAIKKMTSMAVLTTFLRSNEDSGSFWRQTYTLLDV